MVTKKSLAIGTLYLLTLMSIPASGETLYEMPRTEVIPIEDSESGGRYELYIKLPEKYSEDKDAQYPVVYFTDAVWHIEILSASTEYIMNDVILVGVSWRKDIDEDLKKEYGAHVSRFSDYSFWKKDNPKHPEIQFGKADNHLTFIRNEVFKYVENTYRTDPNNRTYFGYSLGGLFGAYTLLTQPDTFRSYILGSPSVRLLIEGESKVEFKDIKHNANVLITHGDLEKENGPHIDTFMALLRERSDKNLSIKKEVLKGDHQTAFPMTGVRAVTWLSERNTNLDNE